MAQPLDPQSPAVHSPVPGPAPLVASVAGRTPEISDTAFVAVNATVLGDVRLAPGASVWYGAVLRGDCETISIGPDSNVQDNCSAHADFGFPVQVGARVSVGHNAVLHGCTVGDDCLIGMGATVLNGATIGAGSLVAANALVPQGMQVPPGSLVAGVPAKVRRELTDEERANLRLNSEWYVALAAQHRDIRPVEGPAAP
ncbi:gamma carbonic anhydrase family protein [Streptacidiphilus melanogenes]|uniref:gamma carbonic anhydrase family protein n=1 Tax=Streptacidiphilus melanogenes TaxID=411235 RepID=UPI000A0161AD|nr:gamma carbonic anhydrase family protein [Streptacidiphilus melanogenes]